MMILSKLPARLGIFQTLHQQSHRQPQPRRHRQWRLPFLLQDLLLLVAIMMMEYACIVHGLVPPLLPISRAAAAATAASSASSSIGYPLSFITTTAAIGTNNNNIPSLFLSPASVSLMSLSSQTAATGGVGGGGVDNINSLLLSLSSSSSVSESLSLSLSTWMDGAESLSATATTFAIDLFGDITTMTLADVGGSAGVGMLGAAVLAIMIAIFVTSKISLRPELAEGAARLKQQEEIQEILELVKEQQNKSNNNDTQNNNSMEDLIEPLENIFGMSIEDYVTSVLLNNNNNENNNDNRNGSSSYAEKELATLLKTIYLLGENNRES